MLAKNHILAIITSILLISSVSVTQLYDAEALDPEDTKKKTDKKKTKKSDKSKDTKKKTDKKKTKKTETSKAKQPIKTKQKTPTQSKDYMVLFINPKILSTANQSILQAKPNDQVLISAKISNFHSSDLPFKYRVVITGISGNTVSDSFVTGILAPQQMFSPSVSWMAGSVGIYTINYYLEDSDGNWLADPLESQITIGTIIEASKPQQIPSLPSGILLAQNTGNACLTPSGESLTICNTHFEDANGNTLDNVQTGQQTYLVTTIQSHSSVIEDFTVEMQVDGDVIGRSKIITGKASPLRIFQIKEPWILDNPGIYTVHAVLYSMEMSSKAKFSASEFVAKERLVISATGQLVVSGDWDPTKTHEPKGRFWDVYSTFESASNDKCGNICHTPSVITIERMDTVHWYNGDTVSHTITSADIDHTTNPPTIQGDNGLFDSGLIAPGYGFSSKFDRAGVYDYICMVHPWMQGMVVVNP